MVATDNPTLPPYIVPRCLKNVSPTEKGSVGETFTRANQTPQCRGRLGGISVMSPRKPSLIDRLLGKKERVLPETSPVLSRALNRAVTDLDRKFLEDDDEVDAESEPESDENAASRAS